jgi:hypothetical protein
MFINILHSIRSRATQTMTNHLAIYSLAFSESAKAAPAECSSEASSPRTHPRFSLENMITTAESRVCQNQIIMTSPRAKPNSLSS